MGTLTNQEKIACYDWFREVGWKNPVLNDPRVILGHATPEVIDELLLRGMRMYPINRHYEPLPPLDRDAA